MRSIPQYLNFDLKLRRGKGRITFVSVIHSPAGEVGEERFKMPFDKCREQLILLTIENMILRSRKEAIRGPGTGLSRYYELVKEVGVQLFNAIFKGSIRECYEKSKIIAKQQRKWLRIRLRVDPNLAELPWELLYDPQRQDFLVLHNDTPIVRYIEMPQPIGPLLVKEKLRVLVAVANPYDYEPLNIDAEKEKICTVTQKLVEQGLMDLDFITGPGTFNKLLEWRRQKQECHILHFIGHGGYDRISQQGFLIGEDRKGHSVQISKRDLIRLFSGAFDIRLIILNSCKGAVIDSRAPFSNLAMALVNLGIPAVVAMQFEISDLAARLFTEHFYSAIVDGYPVDAALTEARKAIAHSSPESIEWVTPVLFMRAPNGILFDVSLLQKRIEEEKIIASDEYLKAGDYFFEQAISLEIGEEAVQADVQEYLEKARDAYQKAIKLGSKNPEVYFRLGLIQERFNNIKKAVEMYSMAIHLKKDYFDAYLHRGILLMNFGKKDEALKDLEQAKRLQPDNIKVLEWLGKAYECKAH